jgi:hypothetical protein
MVTLETLAVQVEACRRELAGRHPVSMEDVDVRVEALRSMLLARLDASDKAVDLSQTTLTEILEQRVGSLEQARAMVEGTGQGRQILASIGMLLLAALIGGVVSYVVALASR